MGTFSVPIILRNWQNRFLPIEERGEDVALEALVDSGAIELTLPSEVVERLKLVEVGSMQAEKADGGLHTLRIMGMVEVEVQGRVAQVRVIELPRGTRALLGAVPLEEMDWHISAKDRRLLPNPRFPEGPVLPLM